MSERTQEQSTEGVVPPPVLDAAAVAAMVAQVTSGRLPVEDVARIDVLRGLQQLTCAVEGAQAAIAVAFDASQRARAAEKGVRPEKQSVGIAEQIALARRESPHLGRRHLALAKVLDREMPHTFAALRAGHITEWRATILARETACLDVEDRREIDEALAGDVEKLAGMGDRETEQAATSAANGQGLCEACNYAKEAVGWQAWPRPGPRHAVEVITPTGHSCTTVAPPLTGTRPLPAAVQLSPAERHLALLIRAA